MNACVNILGRNDLITALIILLLRIQYKTLIAEACDYFRNSTLEEIARWKK